jgi:hypothetical protein
MDPGPAGGWIYYIDGTTYYEAAPENANTTSVIWSNITNITVGTNLTDGETNTASIISQPGHITSAAQLCVDYFTTVTGQTGGIDIINDELYNDSGMTITPYTTEGVLVENIKTVNNSDKFYTKWIEGVGINNKFPTTTVISFEGTLVSTGIGDTDFTTDQYFVVLQTKKNAIMIATLTPNDQYNLIYNPLIDSLTITSYRTFSFPDFERNLQSQFFPGYDMKLSLVGSEENDGVYEIEKTGTTYTRIFDYELSGLTLSDKIRVDLELLTERPLLYSGKFDLSISGSTLFATFKDGVTSSLTNGSKFIIEDINGNHLYNSNEYTIDYFVKNLYLGEHAIILSAITYVDDDSKTFLKNQMIYDPQDFQVDENDDILIFHWNYPNNVSISGSTNKYKNSNIKRKVTKIYPHPTLVNLSGNTMYIAELNKKIYDDIDDYKIYKVLNKHEQNVAAVTPSIDNTIGTTSFVRCMSTTNIVPYTQEITEDGIIDSIDSFVLKHQPGLNANGIDVYRVNTSLILEGMYAGQSPYFDSEIYVNGLTGYISNNTYSDSSGNTSVYNFILKDKDLVYERWNMSDELSIPFYADVVLDISDDAQDYGFNINVNGIDFYVEFNDDSGITSYTNTTIVSFIDKWENVFYKNGLTIWSGTTSGTTTGDTINHLYIQGIEPNVDVYDFSVRVNKNSSYETDITYNNKILISSNHLYSSTSNFINVGFTTGMVISITGSTFPSNNGEYNIIGLFDDTLELSYQGPMYTETGVTLDIISREYLRRPRESNEKDIKYRFRWVDDIVNDIFLYDLTGENLDPWGGDEKLRYVGVKPLTADDDVVILNRQPNRDKKYVKTPYKQQTVFDELNYTLERFDDDNASILPKPINFFLGYNSKFEGVHRRELIMERVDDVEYSGYADGEDLYFVLSGNSLYVHSTDTVDFLNMGFKPGRYVRMKFDDNKPYTQKIFEDWQDFIITDATKTKLTLNNALTYLSTKGEEYDFIIEQLPEQMGHFIIYGETESEDERLEANMKMIGVSLTEEDEFIFKSSNVNEEGIDYRLLNRKRKEMMNVYPEIYNFVGSYKAILNAINFFGYTDLQLIEYYKNIDEESPLYNKLKRVVIPDLLDREVEGYSYSEDLSKRVGYKKTNLMNLTYNITDEEGNNINVYSLKDVQIKLNGLKNWLRKWVIPVNSNIRDITGVSQNVGTTWRRFDPSTNIFDQLTIENTTAINFNYTATRNFNDNWLVSVRFYTVNGFVPEQFDLKVVTYTKDSNGKLNPQQYFDVYKTDMLPFNFSMNWVDNMYDKFFSVETHYYNERGMGKSVNRMYRLEDGVTYYSDEYKNYILVNNNFKYKYPINMQDPLNVYIVDDNGNIYVIEKVLEETS